MAARKMSQQEQLSLDASMLAHDVFLKLIRNPSISWQSRRHFFGLASEEIRKLLVDHARKRNSKKRNAGQRPAPLEAVAEPVAADDAWARDVDLLDLDAALLQFEQTQPELAEVVKLSYFTGLSSREIAELQECDKGTVNRRLQKARMLLHNLLTDHADGSADS